MQKLHNNIKRLSNDVTNSIDDISRYISMQYMKKKSNELRQKKEMYESMSSNSNHQGFNNNAVFQPQQQPQQLNPMAQPIGSPPLGRNLSSRSHLDNEDYLNSDLFNSHPVIHNYGKIEQNEKNFESLNRQTGDRNALNEKNSGQNYQPL